MISNGKLLRIGIACYPSVGGSGIVATRLGEELAARGHEIHMISYERPVRLSADTDRILFHPVEINTYGLFKYPDYTLPLSVRLAEVSRDHNLDLIHTHYAVPHATAALLARDMLPEHRRPKVITTLHGTDTTLLGRDPGYGPAIRHALEAADGITAVSEFLRQETHRLIAVRKPIEVIHNFYTPAATTLTRQEVRESLGVSDSEVLLFHASNLRSIKRVDALLNAFARVRTKTPAKLLICAGGAWNEFVPLVENLGIKDRIVVREQVPVIEDYLQAADLGVFTSESESFCLGILEAMTFACPSVSTAVGGIPEVIEHGESGSLVPLGNEEALLHELERLIDDPKERIRLGNNARLRAKTLFSTSAIVEHYLRFYQQVCNLGTLSDGAGM